MSIYLYISILISIINLTLYIYKCSYLYIYLYICAKYLVWPLESAQKLMAIIINTISTSNRKNIYDILSWDKIYGGFL